MIGSPDRGEDGFSLVESVVALAILGLIVAAMVGGMATSIATSDIHRQQSESNAVMVSAAEIIKSSAYSSSCPPTYSTDAALRSGWPSNAIVATAKFWNGSGWTPTCQGGAFPMQLVTITVTDPDKNAVVSIDVVKRGP